MINLNIIKIINYIVNEFDDIILQKLPIVNKPQFRFMAKIFLLISNYRTL